MDGIKLLIIANLTSPIFQVAIHFYPSHSQLNVINSSFCAQVGLLLTKLYHYFNNSIETNRFFWLFTVTLKIGNTAPLRQLEYVHIFASSEQWPDGGKSVSGDGDRFIHAKVGGCLSIW